jgi:predicted dehydrogenase
MERRTFVKNTALTAAGFAILPSAKTMAAEDKKVRIGMIGTGLRGQNHLELLLRRKDVDIKAVCDIDDRMLKMTAELFKKAGQAMPQVYTGDPYAYRRLLALPDIDAVIIATPWEWHTVMTVDALDAKKYVGCEVVMGITLEDHWEVVQACERNRGHYMMLENVCYRRDVLAVLNMVRQNIFDHSPPGRLPARPARREVQQRHRPV